MKKIYKSAGFKLSQVVRIVFDSAAVAPGQQQLRDLALSRIEG